MIKLIHELQDQQLFVFRFHGEIQISRDMCLKISCQNLDNQLLLGAEIKLEHKLIKRFKEKVVKNLD